MHEKTPAPLPPRLRALAVTAFAALTSLQAQHTATEAYDEPARFRVTDEVVNADVPAFTATIGSVGNTIQRWNYAYEPLNWRTQWRASEDARGKVVVGPKLGHYNTLGDGFLDGGFVRVYRVEGGEMKLVADERIAEGGFVLRDWRGGDLSKALPAGTEQYVKKWAGWERPDVPYYFAVAAVDAAGNISEKSEAVAIVPPDAYGKAEKARNETKRIRPQKNSGDTEAPPAPTNVAHTIQDGRAEITWDAVDADDLAGYVIYESDYDPATHEPGYFIRLQDPETEIKEGDMIIAGKEITTWESDMVSNRVFGAERQLRDLLDLWFPFQDQTEEGFDWSLAPHDETTPVEEPGVSYLQLELAEGKDFPIGEYTHAGADQDWYEVLEPGVPYQVEVWLKYDGPGEGRATFQVNGVHADEIEATTFRPASEWKKYQTTFTVAEMAREGSPSQSQLKLEGPGTYGIDNFRIYQADTAYLDLLPRDYRRLAESGMISLRTHGPIKTGQATYSMEQFTNPGGVIRGIRKGNTLPQTLEIMRKSDMLPWLQIEFHMAPEEWLAFAEYMAAPYDPDVDTPEDKPYAAKRYAQGREAPWTDAFEEIFFELSNETWNGLFRPWTFGGMVDQATGEKLHRGYVYGLFQEHVLDVMRSSPYWTDEIDEKFTWVIGGWRDDIYGFQAGRASPNSKYITNAAYNGGWDEGEGPPQPNPPSYFNALAQVNQTAIPRALTNNEKLAEVNDDRPEPALLGVYEAGPGYALAGLNNARVSKEQARGQELVMKSRTSGTATLDSFLGRAYHGYKLDNFFTFSEGRTWSSHAKWYRGGQAYPQWMVLEVFNNHGAGDFLKVDAESAPTIDLPAVKRRGAAEDAPLAAAYATRDGDRLTVFLINRKIPGYPVEGDEGLVSLTVELPVSGAENIRLFTMSGDYNDENYTGPNVEMVEEALPAENFSGVLQVEVPAAQTQIYVFEGVSD
ncbi:MAG: carbohydrate binding domain-containing protein [Puniceicoccaceae bacterium]